MGVCSSRVVEVGGDPQEKSPKSPSSRNSRRSKSDRQKHWTEARSRSLAGHLVQTHDGIHSDVLLEDSYSYDSTRVLGSGMSGQVVTMRHRVTGAPPVLCSLLFCCRDLEAACAMTSFHKKSRARPLLSGVTYAVKTLSIDQMGVDKLDELLSEVNAMRRLDHPNIVKLYEVFEEEHEIHLVMELCTGGMLVEKLEQQVLELAFSRLLLPSLAFPHLLLLTFYSHLRQAQRWLPEREVARLVAKLLSALAHCHASDVLHRDIKLENLMYETPSEGAEVQSRAFSRPLTPSHVLSRLPTPSHAFSRPLAPSHAFSRLLRSSSSILGCRTSARPPRGSATASRPRGAWAPSRTWRPR